MIPRVASWQVPVSMLFLAVNGQRARPAIQPSPLVAPSGPVRPSRLVYPRSADSAKVWPGLGAVAATVGPRDELFVAAAPQPKAFTMR